jgi:hypothetical protein
MTSNRVPQPAVQTNSGEWPATFPPGTPPADAVPADGLLLRLVKTLPPQPSDFLPSIEEHPGRPYDDLVVAYGVSFSRKVKDLKRKQTRYHPLRDKVIARVTLTPPLGKMRRTGSRSHTTVWFRSAARPHLAPCEAIEEAES